MRLMLVLVALALFACAYADKHSIEHKNKNGKYTPFTMRECFHGAWAEGVENVWEYDTGCLIDYDDQHDELWSAVDKDQPLTPLASDINHQINPVTYNFEIKPDVAATSLKDFMKWANGDLDDHDDEEFNELSLLEAQAFTEKNTVEYLAQRQKDDPLPERYTFFDKYPKCKRDGRSQESCGSCWAFAATTMLTHRTCKVVEDLRKADSGIEELPDDWMIGAQSMCSCCNRGAGICNNGCCGGGFVRKAIDQAKSLPLYQSDCATYESWDGNNHPDLCDEFKDKCPKDKLWLFGSKRSHVRKIAIGVEERVTIWGASDDAHLQRVMRELYDNGPLTIKIKTHANFMGYRGRGAFSAPAPTETVAGKHKYHAMVLIGWDVINFQDQQLPVWIVENSWGERYYDMPRGMRHMVYLLRGANTMGFETYTMYGARPSVSHPSNYTSFRSLNDAWPGRT